MKKIISQYHKLKQDLRTEFIKYFYDEEQEYIQYYLDDSNEGYWIGWWNTLWIWDCFFDLEDVIFVFEHNVPCWHLLDWYWWYIDEAHEDFRVNLNNYVSIRWNLTHEDFLAWITESERKRKDPAEIAKRAKEEKETLEKLKKQFDLDIQKHITRQ